MKSDSFWKTKIIFRLALKKRKINVEKDLLYKQEK